MTPRGTAATIQTRPRVNTPAGVRLEPIQPIRLKERALLQIRRLIDDGVLHPGERLPGERQLSEQLQVSRGTLREALQFLQVLGLLEIRHGEGAFVRASREASTLRLEWREWIVRHRQQVRGLLEVREGLEAFAAELAAQRADAEGLGQMEEALRQMGAGGARPDVAALVQADILFHDALVRCAGNPVLRDLVNTLGQQLIPERAALWDIPGRPQRSLVEHRRIYDAVKAQDGRMARIAIREHIGSVRRDVDVYLLRGAPSDPDGSSSRSGARGDTRKAKGPKEA